MRPRKVGPIDNVHSASARAAKAGSIDERLEETRSPLMGSVNTSQTIVKQGVTPNGNGARGRDLGPARIAMKIHTGEPIHGASHHKTEAPLGVLEAAFSTLDPRERD